MKKISVRNNWIKLKLTQLPSQITIQHLPFTTLLHIHNIYFFSENCAIRNNNEDMTKNQHQKQVFLQRASAKVHCIQNPFFVGVNSNIDVWGTLKIAQQEIDTGWFYFHWRAFRFYFLSMRNFYRTIPLPHWN